MAKIHRGATISPHFRDFVPAWLAVQPWCAADVGFEPVATWRMEDPGGEVGLETWLLRDGHATLCVPLSYRGAPAGADDALIGETTHSALGRRWIYDATQDPVYVDALWSLVDGSAPAEPGGRTGHAETEAHGLHLGERNGTELIVRRRLEPGSQHAAHAVGVVMVRWAEGAEVREACAAEFL